MLSGEGDVTMVVEDSIDWDAGREGVEGEIVNSLFES